MCVSVEYRISGRRLAGIAGLLGLADQLADALAAYIQAGGAVDAFDRIDLFAVAGLSEARLDILTMKGFLEMTIAQAGR